MADYPTPHIAAKPSDFAKTVLMPGDPLRAKYIAETYLENATLISSVRGILAYTGTYKGKPVSVMASGMGIPSIGIYSYELYTVFGVEAIIRVGSAGSICSDLGLRDIAVGMGACTDSAFGNQYRLNGTFAPIADYSLLRCFTDCADAVGKRYCVGNLLSSDVFYYDEEGVPFQETAVEKWKKMGVLALEMESAGLYMTAARCHKRALGICAISDQLLTGEKLTSEERQTTFDDMITIALETAVSWDKRV